MKKIFILSLFFAIVLSPLSLNAQSHQNKKRKNGLTSLIPKKFRNEIPDTLPSSLTDFDDFIVKYVGNHRDGDNVLVEFLITNRSSKDEQLNLSTRYGVVQGVSGKDYLYDFMSGNEYFDHSSFAWEDFTYPSGVTKKVTLVALDVPGSEAGFARLSLSKGERHLPMSFDSLAISDPIINTNSENLRSSKSGVYFGLKNCTRFGQTVIVDFELTSDEDLALSPSSILVYDVDGNQYSNNLLTVGSKTLTNGRKPIDKIAYVDRNTPVECKLSISGFPYATKLLKLMKIVYPIGKFKYYIEARDLDIH